MGEYDKITSEKEAVTEFVSDEKGEITMYKRILLNMDKKENEIVGGEPDEGEAVGGRKEKSYER